MNEHRMTRLNHGKMVRFLKVVIPIVLVSLLALPAASPALAMPPETTTWTYSWENQPLFDCGDFTLLESVVATGRETTFFDQAGAPVRVQLQFTYNGTLTNSVTGASVVDAPDHQLYVFPADQGGAIIHGLVLSANIPGVGVVGLDAGTTVYDADWDIVFQSGPHHVLLPGYAVDYSAICEVLR